MGSIFLVMPKAEDANRIAATIQSYGLMHEVKICSSGSEVLRLLQYRDNGVVLCTKRMRDMSYTELSEYLPPGFGMIVMTNDVALETFSERIVKLLIPFRRSDLIATVEMMTSGFLPPKKKKNHGPRERSEEEQQVVDKAKRVLMERNGMSEPEAFRYIQKNSMDYGRTMVESAQMILLMNSE